MLRAYKTSKSRWAIRGPEGVSRFAGRAQAAVDALETTRKAAIPLVSLSGPHLPRPTRAVYTMQVPAAEHSIDHLHGAAENPDPRRTIMTLTGHGMQERFEHV